MLWGSGNILVSFGQQYTYFMHIQFGCPNKVSLGKILFVELNIDISCKCFSFLAYQGSVQLIYETLGTLIEAETVFTVR